MSEPFIGLERGRHFPIRRKYETHTCCQNRTKEAQGVPAVRTGRNQLLRLLINRRLPLLAHKIGGEGAVGAAPQVEGMLGAVEAKQTQL